MRHRHPQNLRRGLRFAAWATCLLYGLSWNSWLVRVGSRSLQDGKNCRVELGDCDFQNLVDRLPTGGMTYDAVYIMPQPETASRAACNLWKQWFETTGAIQDRSKSLGQGAMAEAVTAVYRFLRAFHAPATCIAPDRRCSKGFFSRVRSDGWNGLISDGSS